MRLQEIDLNQYNLICSSLDDEYIDIIEDLFEVEDEYIAWDCFVFDSMLRSWLPVGLDRWESQP